MDPDDSQALADFLAAYGTPDRPKVYGDPGHCEECAEANAQLLSRTPDELDPAELAEPSKGWFFAWLGDDGWRYFLPGFVRVALSDPQRCLFVLLDRLEEPRLLTALDSNQRRALAGVLEHVQAIGGALDGQQRLRLRRALELLKSGS